MCVDGADGGGTDGGGAVSLSVMMDESGMTAQEIDPPLPCR
jgi:hypothetical protein